MTSIRDGVLPEEKSRMSPFPAQDSGVQNPTERPMMTWKPITRNEFVDLFNSQFAELTTEEQTAFDKYRVPIDRCTIRRSEIAGDESVFVVARINKDERRRGVLYFDDVEYGFNVSTVDQNDVIEQPGGAQYTLAEAVRRWLLSGGSHIV